MTQEWISIHRQHYDQSLGVVQMEKMRGGRGTWWAQAVDGDREIWSVVEIFPNERNPTKLGTLQLDLSPPRLLGRFHKLKNCEWVRQGQTLKGAWCCFFWTYGRVKFIAHPSMAPSDFVEIHRLFWHSWLNSTIWLLIYVYVYLYIYTCFLCIHSDSRGVVEYLKISLDLPVSCTPPSLFSLHGGYTTQLCAHVIW